MGWGFFAEWQYPMICTAGTIAEHGRRKFLGDDPHHRTPQYLIQIHAEGEGGALTIRQRR